MMKSSKPLKVFSLIGSAALLLSIAMNINETEHLVIVDDVWNLNFSRESGFYSDDFELEITSLGGTIYYTLDGSEPTCDSNKYTEPIHISDASLNENIYSMRTDVSVGFYGELLEKYNDADPPNYMIPDYRVDKCTVVRAVVYYGNDIYSEVKTASYFVGFDDKIGYENMNVVSVVTDPDNLFDYNEGMYVTGAVFDNYKANTLENNPCAWLFWNSNYYCRGPEWEKEGSCQFFSNNNLVLSQKCGLRIHGGGSRAFNPKSLNLYARKEYGRYDYFCYNFFGNDYYPSRVTLFQGGNDDKSKLPDYLMSRLTEGLSFCTMDFEPYIVFLDGEYWGVNWLTEKYDEDYIRYHYKVSPDDVIIVKSAGLEKGEEQDMDLYYEMMDFCTTADLSNEHNYQQVCKLIDIDSFIDYYAAMIYIGRYADWPVANEAMWRSRKCGTGYGDGRWRWMLYDVNDAGMTEDLIEFDSYENTLKNAFFANLMSNDVLKNRLLDRIEELGQTVFSENNIEQIINDFRLLMDEPMRQNFRRFWGENSYDGYTDKISNIENFYEQRNDYIPIMVQKHRNE